MQIKSSAIFQCPAKRAVKLGNVAALASFLVSGCGTGTLPSTTTSTIITANQTPYKGVVHGGQQPVSGATIQIYTVGTTGIASASTPLITGTTVLSDSSGGFTIPAGAYSCTSATEVYMTATGGDAGSGNNAALSLMTALGPCGALTASTFISVNELTTVAAVYALSPFMSSYTNIGAGSSYATGIVNAFAMANQLVNSASGNVPATASGLTLPVSRIDTLADILAACVNTSGATSTACVSLLSATGATETIGAGLAIAKNPGSSTLTGLWSLASSSPPFNPTLTTQPNDFTLQINYTGAELLGSYGIAIDANGNAWITNEAGSSVVKAITPTEATSTPYNTIPFSTTTYSAGGILAPRGISIDRSGFVWIANTGGNNVVELNSLTGSPVTGSPFSGGGISAPISVANDSAGNAWVANFSGNSITELGTTGTPSGASPITGAGSLSLPTSIAIDKSGNINVANAGTGQLCIFNNAAILQSCPSDGILVGATSIATSSTGNIALAGSTTGATVTGAFTLVTSGSVNTASPVIGGGLTLPTAVAYDANNNAWFANTSSISEFSGSNAVTPSTGLGSLNSPAGIAVDASGNIWTANTGSNSISIFVGLGASTTTPLAANVGP